MNILKDKKLLIFDCDGVLFDSHNANMAYFNRCLEIAGYPVLDAESAEKVIFMSVRQLLTDLLPDSDEVERVFQISQDLDYSEFIPDLIPMFDFKAVFSELKLDYYLSVATNRGRSLNRLFHSFNFFNTFSFKITALDAKPKPHPDMLNKTMEYYALPPDKAVFIGDSDSDMHSAASAGIDFLRIGKPQGYTGTSIENVADLLKLSEESIERSSAAKVIC